MCDAGVMKFTSDEPYGWFVKEKFTLERNGRDCILRNWQERFLYVTDVVRAPTVVQRVGIPRDQKQRRIFIECQSGVKQLYPHAGPALGTAVTKTLFGDISPAGRCPMTWYSSEKELCGIKDYRCQAALSAFRAYADAFCRNPHAR